MMISKPLRTALLAACLVPPLIAQGARDTGPAIAIPFFGTVTPATPDPGGAGASGQSRLFQRKAGFGPMADTTPHVLRPDFSYTAIFGSATFRVDALSIGLDELHTDCHGVIDLRTCNCWNMVLFAIEDGVGAANASGVVLDELGAVDGAGADVFCYVPITATRIAPIFPGTTTRAVDSRELGFFRGGPSPVKGQISSLDVYAPLYQLDDHVFAQLDPEPTVYFSVLNDSGPGGANTIANVPVGWWHGSTPSGATILARQWDSSLGRWVTRPPLYLYSDLGLGVGAEIDALAHNAASGHTVISLTRATTPTGLSQLLFVENCVDGPTLTDLTESDGTSTGTRRVADGTGVGGSGEVRGVCVEDPSTRVAQPPAPTVGLMAHVMGTPTQDLIPGWTTLDGQTYRSCDIGGNVTYTAHLTGLPPGGGTSAAVFLVGIGSLLPAPIVLFTVPGRPTLPAGDPTSASFPVPISPPALSSVPVEGIWVGISNTTGQLVISHPITMYL